MALGKAKHMGLETEGPLGPGLNLYPTNIMVNCCRLKIQGLTAKLSITSQALTGLLGVS